ncbi:NAD(P)-binding protein [Metschnikowia bicuspidata]|uniref:NAD(P)-binding protein n=1 Tax=Metschnikowia bicuspidata TaxID=27322 RepID=A0A4P9ZFA3_9ASCO|nr:NAD(P)-binding protein [Metschnikowia bicuspidata]
MTTVFVSGTTGFIAQHIVKLLLEKSYRVVGSVRSTAKGQHLASLMKSEAFSFEVVENVEIPGAFDEALKKHPEVTVFLHTASPFHFNVTDVEAELLKPAVNGTKNALTAIKTYGPHVKKVVVTSSYAAISTFSKETDPNHVNDETSWNDITWQEAKVGVYMGYRGSKTFAEQAAWDFMKTEKPGFVINFVNPSYVFGPQAFDSEIKTSLNTSSEMLNGFLKLTPESAVPSMNGGFADVRDVAKAHLVAFEKGLSNERLLLNAGRFCGQDILDVINKRIPQLKGKVPVGQPGRGKEITAGLCKIVNDRTKAILGFSLIDLETSVVDSLTQILNKLKM